MVRAATMQASVIFSWEKKITCELLRQQKLHRVRPPLVSALTEHVRVFWGRCGFAKWLCSEGGNLAFKANLLSLAFPKSPTLPLRNDTLKFPENKKVNLILDLTNNLGDYLLLSDIYWQYTLLQRVSWKEVWNTQKENLLQKMGTLSLWSSLLLQFPNSPNSPLEELPCFSLVQFILAA